MQEAGHGGSERLPRPQRFSMELPIRYRYAGAFHWYRGLTKNLSCSGMLFRGQVPMDLMAPVEVRMALPREITGEAAASMLCDGFITRVAEAPSLGQTDLAATFTMFRLLGRKAVTPDKAIEATRDDLIEQFVHEFRSLLELVIGHADLILRKEGLDPSVRMSATRIRDASERATTLTKALGGKRSGG